VNVRKLGSWAIALVMLALPAWGSGRQGSISGLVRTTTGVPQMGAAVEIFSSATHALTVFTDDHGFYSAAGLIPGIYNIKVSAPAFLPSQRDRVSLRSGASIIINLTLNTIFDNLQVTPRLNGTDDDDWKWTLRSVSSRPILRALDPNQTASAESQKDRSLKATVSFVAGADSEGYGGSSDMSTGFSLEKSLFSTGTLAFGGSVGYASVPTGVLRASYAQQLPNGSNPEIALTVRRFASPDSSLRDAALQAVELRASDSMEIGDFLELKFGSELQSIQFMGHVTTLSPFGSAAFRLTPDTIIEYQYTSSVPNTRLEKGFDSAPSDLSESAPRVSVSQFSPAIERGHHHEVSVSRRFGRNKLQLAAYSDRVANTALIGVGDADVDSGEILPDVYSGSFNYKGSTLDTKGLRVVMQRKVAADLTATLDYAYGGVLDLDTPGVSLADVRSHMSVRQRHAMSGQLAGKLPGTKGRWITSYRWTSGQALTPVDMFNSSVGQAEPFLNIFIRQPIPKTGFLPGHMEAIIDIRNLLAQGYVPVLSQDGGTVYLVQSARSVRGGVAFSF
jgi:carboxypeptidase family protein